MKHIKRHEGLPIGATRVIRLTKSVAILAQAGLDRTSSGASCSSSMSQSKGSEDEQTSSAAQTWTGSSPYGGKGVGKSKGKSEEPKGLIGARAAKGSKGGDRMFRSEGLSVETQHDILRTMVRLRDLRIAELEAEVAELKEAIAT